MSESARCEAQDPWGTGVCTLPSGHGGRHEHRPYPLSTWARESVDQSTPPTTERLCAYCGHLVWLRLSPRGWVEKATAEVHTCKNTGGVLRGLDAWFEVTFTVDPAAEARVQRKLSEIQAKFPDWK